MNFSQRTIYPSVPSHATLDPKSCWHSKNILVIFFSCLYKAESAGQISTWPQRRVAAACLAARLVCPTFNANIFQISSWWIGGNWISFFDGPLGNGEAYKKWIITDLNWISFDFITVHTLANIYLKGENGPYNT